MVEDALRRLIYVSRSLLAGDPAAVAAGLADILSVARRHNAAAGVTGALVLHEGRFAQALEGEAATVQALLDRIRADPRHDGVEVVEDGAVAARAFPGWSMAYAGEDGAPDIPLTLQDALRPPAPEGEEVLARLRALTRRG